MMLGQRSRSCPVVLALCAAFLILFGISRHVSRQIIVPTLTPGPVLVTSDGYAAERVEENFKVSENQTESKMAEQIFKEDPEKVMNPDFYSDAYWSTSLKKRSEFQKRQVEKYCAMHPPNASEQLPAGQIMIQESRKLAFCLIPESACSMFKFHVLHAQGLISDDVLHHKSKKHPNVTQLVHKTLLNKLSSSQWNNVMKGYFKFMMFRNPLERLFRAYKNKMSEAVKTQVNAESERDIRDEFFIQDKRNIISDSYPYDYRKWKAADESYAVNITFSVFIDYWLNSESLTLHTRFNPIVRLCRPCLVHYDYYGNFKSFQRDAKMLMERIGVVDDHPHMPIPALFDSLAEEYYGELSDDQKIRIVKKLAPELELYYMLFPPERDSHKEILGLNIDV